MKNRCFKFCALLLIVILSGCSVNYDLYLENNNFTEIMEIYEQTSGLDVNKLINNVKNQYGVFYEIDMYTDLADCGIACVSDVPIGISTYKEYYTVKNYVNSKAILEYFGNVTISQNNGVYTFKAIPNQAFASLLSDDIFNKASVSEVNINIHIPYNVISHNASSIDGDTYIFKYNSSNYKKEINISYSINVEDVNQDEISKLYGNSSYYQSDNNVVNKTNNNSSLIGYVFAVIGVIMLVIVIYFISKNRKNNDL